MQNQSPDLSARDVNLLHHIIVRAQNHPEYESLPKKALLETYYAVFYDNGLDTNKDRACFRLLLQLGEPGVPGEEPYDRFEHLLAKSGIALDYEEDGVSMVDTEHNELEQETDREDTRDHADIHTSPRKVERRNSFTSMYDVTAEVARKMRKRSLERLSEPRGDVDIRPQQVEPAQVHQPPSVHEHAEDLQSATSDGETQTTFDDPKAREAGRQALEFALQAAQQHRSNWQSEQEMRTKDHLVQIMQVAAQKDRLTLLKQAFGLWRDAVEVVKKQRRVVEIDRAIESFWDQQFRRAAAVSDKCLLDKAFCHWAFRSQEKAESVRLHLLELKYFTKWCRFTALQELKAERFAKKSILAKWVNKLKDRKSQYQGLESRVQLMEDWRIVRKYFAIWLLRTRTTFKADAVNVLRIKQKAFSTWNEQLRYKAIKDRINERVLAEALYRWALAHRETLLRRRCDARRKREAFQALLRGYRRQQGRLADQESRISAQVHSRLVRNTWECWILQMNVQRERNRMAQEFYNPKIQLDNIVIWRDRLRHVQRQELRSQDARYYFLMTKTIKHWHAVAVETKKRRINEAYKIARRLVKANLLRSVLAKWHTRIGHIHSMQWRSQAKHDQKTRAIVQSVFVKWQISTSQLGQAAQQASAHYESYLLKQAFDTLLDASRKLRTLQMWAGRFHSVRDSAICSTQLRRISMKAFEIKRRHKDADAMRERHWANHLRNILRHWAIKSRDVTLVPQKPSPLSTEQETVDAGYGTGTGTATATGSTVENPWNQPAPSTAILGATQRAEEWTAFDQDLLEGGTTPAYLNTPSKRAARVRALANVTGTPSTPWTAGRSRGVGGGNQLGKFTGRRAHLFRDIG